MIFTGMIYQYDNTQGVGLIMLSDGKTKEFTNNDWTDTINTPAVGQKVSYESDANRVQIKIASKENVNKGLADEEKNVSTANIKEFTNFNDCLKYFTDMGFKLVKDVGSDASRTVTLRSYSMDEYGEALIKQNGSKISVTQTLNGKLVY